MIINVDLLKLKEWSEENVKIIFSNFNSRVNNMGGIYGELDPSGGVDTSLKDISHTINKLWIEDDRIFGEIRILSTHNGNIVKEIIKDELELISILKAVNRENAIDTILFDDYEYDYKYPSDILDKKGIYFSIRAAGVYTGENMKLSNFFTFDIKTKNTQTLFVDN